MLRQPIKTALFVALIAFLSFSFSARMFEGLIVNREITYLSKQYHAVGRLIAMDDWDWEATEVRNILEASPFVHYTETLKVIPGVVDGVYSPDIDGRTPFTNQMFVYGTLINKGHLDQSALELVDHHVEFQTQLDQIGVPFMSVLSYIDIYYFDILVDAKEAALPESAAVGDRLRLFLIDYRNQKYHVYTEAQVGERYLVNGQYGHNMRFISNAFRILPPRLIEHRPFLAVICPVRPLNDMHLQLRPLTESGIYLYPASVGEVADAEILDQIDILHENIHTTFLRTTRDMSLRTDGVFLREGRLLNDLDYENENRVTVIRAEFAALRNLSVGDTLTITMRESQFSTEYILPDTMRFFPVPQAGIRYDWETFAAGFNVHNESLGFNPVSTYYAEFDIILPLNRNLHFYPPPPQIRWNSYGLTSADNFPGPVFDGIVYNDILYADLRGADEIINLEMTTGYITNSENDRYWREAQTQTETFEIVGIYGTTDRLSNFATVSHNNVFVPSSVIPATWTQDVVYRNLNFVLNSPADEDEFTLTYQPMLEEMGFWPLFTDSGWDNFIAVTTPIQNGILIGILAFAVLTLVVLYLMIFLYFSGRRREFAVSRALGMEKKHALLSTSLPILLIGLLGLLIGITPAWHFSITQAERTLSNIDEEIIFSQPPLVWFLFVVLALVGVMLIFSSVEISKLARCSELELLQGNGSAAIKVKKKGRKRKKLLLDHSEPDSRVVNQLVVTKLDISLLEIQVSKRIPGIIHLTRTIVKYIVRKPAKSFLSIIIALNFMLILSWMPVLIDENTQQVNWLYENTIVTATTVVDPLSGRPAGGSISSSLLRNITELGLEDEEGAATGDLFIALYHAEAQYEMAITLLESNDFAAEIDEEATYERFILGLSSLERYESFHNATITIEYADDFDLDIFEQTNLDVPVILISERYKEQLAANMGDYLRIVPLSERWDPEPHHIEFYRIVGTFDSPDITQPLITPLVYLQNHRQQSLRYDRVEFELNPMLNRELDIFQEEVEEILRRSDLILILHDHILREVVSPLEQNVTMMQTLYPIILVLSIFIAAGLATLLLLPSVKDVAIMRATGMSKLSSIIILGTEQTILCILGLLLGVIVSTLAFGSFNFLGLGLYFAGCVLATLVFSTITANRKPLELLQVRE